MRWPQLLSTLPLVLVWNRPPLSRNALAQLPLGAIRAQGWLLEQLQLSASGLTGRMMDIWPDVGAGSGWLGGNGENWERGPYYLRGLLSLAHTLGSRPLIARAEPWIEWTLASQTADGFFGPRDNDDWWPRMPMLEALRWHHAATGDRRVIDFMGRYFAFQAAHLPQRPLEFWGKPRAGDNLDSVLWLFNQTGDAALLDLAHLLHQQGSDWIGELQAQAAPDQSFEFGHGVNRAMGMKEPMVYSQLSPRSDLRRVFRDGWERLMAHHGQINGMFSGDEFLHGRGSAQGTELCTIVEQLSTFQTAFKISGETWIADAMERIAYNALPATLSADHCSHQYFQLPNQIECTPGGRNFHVHHETDLLFGTATGYGCCAANFHMGWPQFVNHLWLATADGGLCAPILAPSVVTASVAGGRRVSVVEDTNYPFADSARFVVRSDAAVIFPLYLRVPGWAESFEIFLNEGDDAGARPCPQPGLHVIEREWRNGDSVTLKLPMRARVSDWERGSIGIERGPLVYALRIGEEWRQVGGSEPFGDCELHPTTPWNYGLIVDRAAPEASIAVEPHPLGKQPWAQDGAAVHLRVAAQRLPDWQVDGGVSAPLPEGELRPNTPTETVTLIPYGCARLRISMFPAIR